MNTRATVLAAVTGVLLSAVAPGQPAREQPVGLVLTAENGRLIRAGSELPLTARAGDVLYAGDGLRSETGSLTFLYCPDNTSRKLEPGSEVVAESGRLRVVSGKAASARAVDYCRLPELERVPAASQQHYGGSMTRGLGPAETGAFQSGIGNLPEARLAELKTELAPIDKALAADPRNQAARVARASLFEKYGLGADALEDYRRIAEEWPDAVWVRSRIFVHEKEQARVARPLTPREGKTYALLVGISRYQRVPEQQWLRYAHQDALVLDRYLRSPRGGALPDSNVVLLTDEKATTAAIRNAFETFLKARAGKNDTVIVFIAAHGIVEAAGRRAAYLVTHDSDPEDLASTALPMSDVQNLVREDLAKVGRVLVYIDACRAGNIGAMRGANTVNKVIEQLAESEGDLFLFLASGPREYSYEGPQYGGGHGAFSYFLLNALNGDADFNRDGSVNVGEVIEHVREKVVEATFGRQHPRDLGSMERAVTMAELRHPGITLAGFSAPPSGQPLLAAATGGPGTRALEAKAGAPGGGGAAESNPVRVLDEAIDAGRILPDSPQSAFAALRFLERRLTPEEYLIQQNKLRIALENQGQQVLLRYLSGDQTPQVRDDFLRGAAFYEAARLLTPESLFLEGRAAFCNGRAKLFEKEYRRAADLLEHSVRIDPGGAYAYNALGIAYLEQADYPRATAAFRDSVRRAPYWAYPLHNQALAHTQTGNYEAAVECYRKAMLLAPQYSYLPYNLGLVYQRLNRRKEAEQAYRIALSLAPNAAEPYNALGYLKASYGRAAEAERLYRQALEKNPELLAARHNLAVLLAGKPDRVDEAHELWKQNLSKAPGYLASRLSFARSLARQGRQADAIEQYSLAVKQKPDYVAARLALADLHLSAGSPADALAELRAASGLQPENASVYERIGEIERRRGRLAEAAAAYESALKYAPDNSTRKRVRAELRAISAGKK